MTDKGWAPRSRQVGITGRSIAPALYVALGLSGKFNHMVGVRGAGTVLAVNRDPDAPVFEHADIGIVAEWEAAVDEFGGATAPTRSGGTGRTRRVGERNSGGSPHGQAPVTAGPDLAAPGPAAPPGDLGSASVGEAAGGDCNTVFIGSAGRDPLRVRRFSAK